jgi:hypothetical protein
LPASFACILACSWWLKLDEYYRKLDDSPAYAAALFCHLSFRLRQAPMKKALQKVYDNKYKPQSKEEEEQTGEQGGPDFLNSYLP